jgi:hypothetical protein
VSVRACRGKEWKREKKRYNREIQRRGKGRKRVNNTEKERTKHNTTQFNTTSHKRAQQNRKLHTNFLKHPDPNPKPLQP